MTIGIDVKKSEIENVKKIAQEAGVILKEEESPFTSEEVTLCPTGSSANVDIFFNLYWNKPWKVLNNIFFINPSLLGFFL